MCQLVRQDLLAISEILIDTPRSLDVLEVGDQHVEEMHCFTTSEFWLFGPEDAANHLLVDSHNLQIFQKQVLPNNFARAS